MSRRTLDALRVLSLADALLLGFLVWAAVTGRHEAVAILGPTHGALFLVLVGSLAVLAWSRRVAWRFTLAVTILGPLASVPGLELYRRGGRV